MLNIPVMSLQGGPTELYLPAAEVVEQGAGLWIWFGWVAVVLVLVATVLWVRAMNHKRIDPRELAFRAMIKKLGLSNSQVSSIRTLAETSGAPPIALIMSPSAVRSAAAGS